MKAENKTTPHTRTINITKIRKRHCLPALTITIGYTGDSNCDKGVTLDHAIIPAIIKALNGGKKAKASAE